MIKRILQQPQTSMKKTSLCKEIEVTKNGEMNGQRRRGAYIKWNYYSAIEKNETMPFAATWMDLDIIILSEVRQRKTNIV